MLAMDCIIHYNDVKETALTKLNERNFNTIRQCAQQWLSLERYEKRIFESNSKLWDCTFAEIRSSKKKIKLSDSD